MEIEPVLTELAVRDCRFVVVGSAARSLCGEDVDPRDLDLVVDAALANREPLLTGLADLGGSIQRRHGRRPIEVRMALPWEWGWQMWTDFGDVDVITRFCDGSTFDDHDPYARNVVLASGAAVRCRPTRHPA